MPRLDPVEDMNIVEAAVGSAVRRIEELEGRLATNEVFKVQLQLVSRLGLAARMAETRY